MNRRPSQSRTGYDSFSPHHAAHFTASTPGNDFFDVRKRKPLALRMAFSFFLLFLALLAVNFLVNQFIHVARVTVPVTGLDEEFDGYTLLHISDLKGATFGSGQRLLSFALGRSEFDAVVLTGDMLSAHENAQPLYALIERLRAVSPDAPICFIAGDDDPPVTSSAYFTGGSPFAPWVLGAQQRGAQLLSSPQAIARGAQTVWLMAGNHLSLDVDTMQGQFELRSIPATKTRSSWPSITSSPFRKRATLARQSPTGMRSSPSRTRRLRSASIPRRSTAAWIWCSAATHSAV